MKPPQSRLRRLLQWLGLALGVVVLAVVGLIALGRSPGEAMTPAGLRRNLSLYVPVHDGTRLAVEIWLPANLAPGRRLPAIFRPARYVAAGESGPLERLQFALGREPGWLPGIDVFTKAGYAWIAVSLRGTGAPFGTRNLELGDAEVDDLMEVLDWVVRQPWSDGRVALMGGSYDGVTAEVLAGRGHPAVKAAVWQVSWLDTYEFLFPGGLYRQGFVNEWTRVALGFDANDWPTAMGLDGWQRQALGWFVRGHKPVDGVGGKRLLREAVAGHRPQPANELSRDTIYRDDKPRGAVTNWNAFSSYRARAGLEHAQVPLQVWVSWLDAHLATHALARFLTYRVPQQLVICAWNHHLVADGDPFKPLGAPADPPPAEQWRMIIEFLDAHLKGGVPARSEIRFTTLSSGGWTTVSNWPPPGFAPRRWYLGSDRRLQLAPLQETLAVDRYEVDFEATTGAASRWNHFTPDIVYPDRAAADARLLTYTSEPLELDLEVTGSPVVHLEVVSSATDGAFHAYLEDVAPDGRVTYVTEGALRALHRQQTVSELPYHPLGPKRSFRRGESAPLVPGEVATLEFDLYATSVRFRQGHRLRLALAGADAGNFARMPAEGALSWEVQRGRDRASWVELPARASQPLPDRHDPQPAM